jgi:hypothetical protein
MGQRGPWKESDMSTDPSQHPEPEVLPSSTPDGPQVIPSPATPEGEPGPDAPADYANRPSNPNSTGPEGLSGGMGVSSERTGPEGADPRNAGGGIAGTGSKGGAVHRTDGGLDTSPTEWDAVDVSQSRMHPDRDTELDDTSGVFPEPGVDRTVGEPRPNPIDAERTMHTDNEGPSRSV